MFRERRSPLPHGRSSERMRTARLTTPARRVVRMHETPGAGCLRPARPAECQRRGLVTVPKTRMVHGLRRSADRPWQMTSMTAC